MKKEELVSEIINAFAGMNRIKAMIDFQVYLKGENFLLSYLYKIGGESTPSELAHALNISAPRVAAILRSLELKKLIKRKGNGIDRRRVSATITEKGIEWVSLANSEIYKYAVNVFDKLGEEDTKELIRIMNKIIKIEDTHPVAVQTMSDIIDNFEASSKNSSTEEEQQANEEETDN